ncbi:MAG TPA: hypothetical protein VMU26_00830 [Candidatus Polarisedimenticolia bacterium]|nr:hypothetical protein [Candidatus Polarisedimenticolia bacterium]
MSDKIRIFYYVLWIAHPILQTAIAAAMFRFGRHRQFRYFFAYIVAQIVSFAVVFPTYRYHLAAWPYLSWLSTAVSVALGFKVIHEAFLDAFRPFHTLRDLGTVLFKWAGLVMLLVAGVVSVSTNSSDSAPWVQAILTAQRCVRIIQVGMVLFLIFFARYLGVSRRQYSFGIALGFGCFAMVELSLVASWVGDHLNNLSLGLVNMAAYNCALLVWLTYTLAESPVREAPANLLRPQRWEQSLTDIHHPLPADSLIPMFEGMVDRALSRTQTSPSTPQENVAPAKAAAAQAGAGSSSTLGFPRVSDGVVSTK